MKDAKMTKRRNFAYGLLIFSSFLIYVIITSSKNLYTAEKTTFYSLGTFGNLTDLASTMEYYFYTYAAMQILLVFFMKKMNTKWFLTLTVGMSAIVTTFVAFTSNVTQHYIIFSLNGIFQAGLWGGLIKIISMYLPARLLPLANQLLTTGPALSGALAYGVAAAFGDNWKLPFMLFGIVILASVVTYFIAVTYASKFPKEESLIHIVNADGSEEDVSSEAENDFIHLDSKHRVVIFYIMSAIVGFILASVYYLLYNNLDIFLKEVGGYSNDVSKLLVISAPLCAALGPIITVNSCERHKNFIIVCAVYFGIAAMFLFAIVFLFAKSVIASLVLIIVFLTLVSGGRSISLSVASLKMREKVDSGVYATLVNASASVATGSAPKIVTRILDNSALSVEESWRVSFAVILIFCIVSVLLLFALALWIKIANRKSIEKRVAQVA